MTTVAELFEVYRRKVLPAGAPMLHKECERAFYAGAYAMLMAVLEITETDDEDACVAALEALTDECETFAVKGPAVEPPDVNYTTADAAAIAPVLREMGEHIKGMVPDGWGFTLLMFQFGEGGNLFYLSNAQRGDVLSSMREFLKKQTQ